MRLIKLLKDHEDVDGVLHKAGSEINVDLTTYDWLMQVYINERKQQVDEFKSINRFFDKGTKDDK